MLYEMVLKSELAELRAFRDAALQRARRASRSLTKAITIRGVTYESKEAAAQALGVKPGTIKWAKANGRLNTVGNGKGSNWNEAQRKSHSEKIRKIIELDGAVFHGWKEATHITSLSRQTLIRRGAVVT